MCPHRTLARHTLYFWTVRKIVKQSLPIYLCRWRTRCQQPSRLFIMPINCVRIRKRQPRAASARKFWLTLYQEFSHPRPRVTLFSHFDKSLFLIHGNKNFSTRQGPTKNKRKATFTSIEQWLRFTRTQEKLLPNWSNFNVGPANWTATPFLVAQSDSPSSEFSSTPSYCQNCPTTLTNQPKAFLNAGKSSKKTNRLAFKKYLNSPNCLFRTRVRRKPRFLVRPKYLRLSQKL